MNTYFFNIPFYGNNITWQNIYIRKHNCLVNDRLILAKLLHICTYYKSYIWESYKCVNIAQNRSVKNPSTAALHFYHPWNTIKMVCGDKKRIVTRSGRGRGWSKGQHACRTLGCAGAGAGRYGSGHRAPLHGIDGRSIHIGTFWSRVLEV